jgi:hypothetical protein
MNLEATLESGTISLEAKPLRHRVRATFRRLAIVLVVATIAGIGWLVRRNAFYTSGSSLGYSLGLIGGLMMLLLLVYPLRKRVRFMQGWGPLKYWFWLHMSGGILGPLLVLFHSTFRVGSLNAGVALTCMLLVVASGLVGRFLYRKIHHGLYGSHATLKELQQALERELKLLEPQLSRIPSVKHEVDHFTALVSRKPSGWRGRAAHFLSLGWKRFLVAHRVRSAIASSVTHHTGNAAALHADFADLLKTIDAALHAAQRTAQFSTYERLFSLWHVVHIPFLGMLVITAIIHVVAVHVY